MLELDAQLPSWARFRRRSWALTGHRIVTPLYDATGNMRSLRAWRWAGGDTPKRLAPAGFTCAGLVMADALGLLLLQTGERPAWWPPHVPLVAVVVEGEPDYLTRATLASDADETAPAVFGLVSGSWSDEVAERIPTDTVVTLRTDTDLAGATYAHVVARSLAPRCPVRRLTA